MPILIRERGKLIVESSGRLFDFDSGWECMAKIYCRRVGTPLKISQGDRSGRIGTPLKIYCRDKAGCRGIPIPKKVFLPFLVWQRMTT